MNKQKNEQMNEWTYKPMYEQKNKWMNEKVKRKNGCNKEQTSGISLGNEWINKWMNESMKDWMNEWRNN